jgi:hypothetical protein
LLTLTTRRPVIQAPRSAPRKTISDFTKPLYAHDRNFRRKYGVSRHFILGEILRTA